MKSFVESYIYYKNYARKMLIINIKLIFEKISRNLLFNIIRLIFYYNVIFNFFNFFFIIFIIIY